MLAGTSVSPSERYYIREVPIFSAGVRDGVYYSIGDIDAIVANHQLTNRTWMPAAGLGHYGDGASLLGDLERTKVKPNITFKQIPLIWPNLNKLGCTGTAEPAVGWITKLWRVGRTLWARVEDIPAAVAQMLKDKLFRFVSAEIYQRPPDGIPGEGCFLHGMGFLGKTPPEVKTLGEVPPPELQTFSQKNCKTSTSSNASQLVLKTIVTQLPELGVRVFSEVKTMDLNQLATNLKLSPDAVKALGTLPPADQDALKTALTGTGAGAGGTPPPAALAEISPEIAAMSREQVVAKLTELGEDSEYFEAMSDDELKQLLADAIDDEAEAFDGIEVPADIAAMSRDQVVAELVTLGEDQTTLSDLSDDDLKRLLTELKMPAANSDTTADEAKKKEEEAKAAAANSAKAHSQKGLKPASKQPANRPNLKVFSEQEVADLVEQKVSAALSGVSSNVKELQAASRRELAVQRRRELRRRESQIEAFCERGIKERKIMPYELDENRKDAQGKTIPSLRSILRQASTQVVAFSEGGKQVRTTLASQIMRFINSRKPVAFSEIIPGDGGNNGSSGMSPERRKELLGYTGLGSQILSKETAVASKN